MRPRFITTVVLFHCLGATRCSRIESGKTLVETSCFGRKSDMRGVWQEGLPSDGLLYQAKVMGQKLHFVAQKKKAHCNTKTHFHRNQSCWPILHQEIKLKHEDVLLSPMSYVQTLRLGVLVLSWTHPTCQLSIHDSPARTPRGNTHLFKHIYLNIFHFLASH